MSPALRIVDASLNRAREGLRTVEDWLRFDLAEPALTARCKQLRHQLGELSQTLPTAAMLASRDSVQDVGATLRTQTERSRAGGEQAAAAGLKRAQEALRSLHEAALTLSPSGGPWPGVAEASERLRFATYDLERVALGRWARRQRVGQARLCLLLTPAACALPWEHVLSEALAGGVDLLQLRDKPAPGQAPTSDRLLLERARHVVAACRAAGALAVVNDRVDLALAAGADGCHLGRDDLPLSEARRLAGPDLLLGHSAHSVEQAEASALAGADLLGLGPVFASSTKPEANAEWGEVGLETLRAARAAVGCPILAIGGVTADRVAMVLSTGVTAVAVSAAILRSPQPRAAAAALRAALAHEPGA